MEVKQFANIIRQHLREDYDAVIAVTSIFEGEGKSTLAQLLAMEIGRDLYKMEENTLFNPKVDEIKHQILNLPQFSVINADEAIKILYKLRHYERMSVFMNQLYALARFRNLATIFCMPRYRDFSEFFRNHKIKFWIHIIERGHAVIFIKDWNPFTRDPWHLDENDKIVKNAKWKMKNYEISVQEKTKLMEKCKNFMGLLEFSDLSEDLKKQYSELREKHKFDDITAEHSGVKYEMEKEVSKVLNDPEFWKHGRVHLATFRAKTGIRGALAEDIKALAELRRKRHERHERQTQETKDTRKTHERHERQNIFPKAHTPLTVKKKKGSIPIT